MGCCNANSQATLRALLTESNVFFNSDVMLIGISIFKQHIEWKKFLDNPGKKNYNVSRIAGITVKLSSTWGI